ncbi:hypothetical protein H8F24_00905 [Synechococcus sp. CBW1002]|jgi:hypothetical protein|uniref:hypothetical protein n=1 Tax=Synechococcus sp. CBW1002 TaxID=1353134 RepID=UPI0018CDF9A0|nr:hypothetical protein [Synechococcus sp. CBW1002]QPN60100.1 hypothetical protein H8F24_00905 [Synechococcus sp. CBW1002]
MNDYQLGAALRERVLQLRSQNLPIEGRRLQGLVGDLCGSEQTALLPALRHLVLSAAFHSGASQARPLADPRLAARLMAELREVFAVTICARMEGVVLGLLALPGPMTPSGSEAAPHPGVPRQTAAVPVAVAAVPVEVSAVQPPVVPQMPPAAPAAEDVYAVEAPRASGGSRGLVAFLAFLTGSLSVALVAVVLWMHQSAQQSALQPSAPVVRQPVAPPTPAPVSQPEPPQVPELPEPEPTPEAATAEQAMESIRSLYESLSRKDFEQARQWFAGAAADQFDAAFFEQFQQVTVSDLQTTGSNGSSLTLDGVVTFVYPDGTSQSETRSFTVDTATSPALITNSAFVRVLQARR